MAAARTPLQELEAVARAAQKFVLVTRFDLPCGTRLIARMGMDRMPGKPPFKSWLSLCEETGAGSECRFEAVTDIDDAIRKVRAAYPEATLLAASIEVAMRKGPMAAAKAKPVAVRAWHEAFGLPIPSLSDLARIWKEAKALKRSAAEDTVALLRTGPPGVRRFNRRLADERATTDLRKADLAHCDLSGVKLEGANLAEADLSGANLTEARFYDLGQGSNLQGAKLPGANLSGAWLARCKCVDADFSRANLTKANVRSGDYQRASFSGANLTDADFTWSDVRGADFTGAVLAGCQFELARFDERTQWPAGFELPAELVWKGNGPDPRRAAPAIQMGLFEPSGFAGFLDRLQLVTVPAKLKKALAMLKADRFQLFARVQPDHLVGVVKSQTDKSLVYSCRLGRDGAYACCTQNLNACGGLRGSPCKHLLVLIVGLARAGELDPGTAHEWTRASRGRVPILDKDAMAETLLQYKGAEAGTIDWRPTETIPEDFYAM